MWSGWKGTARVTFDACRASRMFLQLAGDVGALQGQAGSPCLGGGPPLGALPCFLPRSSGCPPQRDAHPSPAAPGSGEAETRFAQRLLKLSCFGPNTCC